MQVLTNFRAFTIVEVIMVMVMVMVMVALPLFEEVVIKLIGKHSRHSRH